MKIGQVRGIRGLLMELTDYEFGSCYWSTGLSKKTLKRLQSFSESQNFSSSENNNKITTTSLRVTEHCYLAHHAQSCFVEEVATTLPHVYVYVPSSFHFLWQRLRVCFFFENISPVYLHGFTLLNNFLWYFGNCLKPGRKLYCQKYTCCRPYVRL